MSRASAAPIMGIATSSRDEWGHVPRAVQQAARRHGIDLRTIGIESIRGLMPSALGREIPSWLIVYSSQDDSNLIMVPFIERMMTDDPDPNAAMVLEKIFASIRADRNAAWSTGIGYRNLVTAEAAGFLPAEASCFQAVRLPSSLRRLFSGAVGPGNVLSESFASKISGWLREANERIAVKRRILRKSLAHSDFMQAEQARADFDAALLDEATQMADQAAIEGRVSEPRRLQLLLNKPELDGLDDECKRFLRTALLCEELGVQEPEGSFDFASAGGPLCKIVERELNMSIGWLVRWLRDVAARESPWIARPDRNSGERVEIVTGSEPGNCVNLNERESDNPERLKGLMLGAIQHLLSFAHGNGVRVEILGQPLGGEWTAESLDRFVFGIGKRNASSLGNAIKKLTGLRNPYAHDKAMNRLQYDKLKAHVIGRVDQSEPSLAARVLSLKQAISGFLASR